MERKRPVQIQFIHLQVYCTVDNLALKKVKQELK